LSGSGAAVVTVDEVAVDLVVVVAAPGDAAAADACTSNIGGLSPDFADAAGRLLSEAGG
jgi:hypothetical protein